VQHVMVTDLRPPLRVEVRSQPLWQPFVWLWRGAQDIVGCWPSNAAQGLLMVAFGWVLVVMLGNHPYFLAAAASGFLLLAPIMTTGMCELSRRRESRQSLDFDGSLEAIGRNGLALFKFGGLLAAFAVGWFLVSELLLKSVFHVTTPAVAETFYRGFADTVNRSQVEFYVASGAVLALLVFVVSVVTVPLIIDRGARASEAMRISVQVVARNPLTMVVWAAVLVSLTAAGFATFLFGLILVIPLLGHGTWHAYRDLIAR